METLGEGDPRVLGPFRLLGRLGAGGMGEVFLGRTAGGRTVAVKTVRQEFAGDQEFRQRFRQEVAAARRVGGRWTAPVLDADTEGAQPWVATGYVAGPSLGGAVRQFGPLPPATVRALGIGLADALAAVHALGLVHRDVKPSNVLLALDGPRLIDFGIARALDATSALTRSGYMVGSPGFMSPEQARGRPAGPPGDVFAFGAVLAFAATGRAPFGEQDSAAGLLYRIVHEEPELDGLDGELLELVRACLAKDADRRPTPDAVREHLLQGGTRLGERGWLPAALSEEVARMAVSLLDLESQPEPDRPPAPTVLAAPAAPYPAPYSAPTAPLPSFGPPLPPLGAPTPAGAYPVGGPTAVRPAGRRWLPMAATGVVAAVLAGLGVWAATGGLGGGGTPGGAATTSAHDSAAAAAPVPDPSSGPSRASSASSSPNGAVPKAFLGTFEGPIDSTTFRMRIAVRFTVHQGSVGQAVADVESDGGSNTGRTVCTNKAALVSASESRLVFRALSNTSNAGCSPLPGDAVVTVNQDGSLHFVQDSFTGEMTRR
ncbi:serine/threonine-protein kinase [Streptomyces sp. TLI_171]|uniref:serine/threonine-protein kinase n=1 Tax=Streptomyces sp. TLI_171 TaxID=1938859 RepID=UPI000C195A30|nr:serine/threonine-protein kinase [Streptomyces sp. TLI_171]RKE22301.1 serine/threonine protein kinase [Streptomyces sp. TLI_171]